MRSGPHLAAKVERMKKLSVLLFVGICSVASVLSYAHAQDSAPMSLDKAAQETLDSVPKASLIQIYPAGNGYTIATSSGQLLNVERINFLQIVDSVCDFSKQWHVADNLSGTVSCIAKSN